MIYIACMWLDTCNDLSEIIILVIYLFYLFLFCRGKMYGDCQVMSSMAGGSGIPSESLFPNFNFMPFNDFSSMIPVSTSLFFPL